MIDLTLHIRPGDGIWWSQTSAEPTPPAPTWISWSPNTVPRHCADVPSGSVRGA